MINLFESFSGYGSQYLALKHVFGKENIKSIGISEVDIDAIITYALIHNKDQFLELEKEIIPKENIPKLKGMLKSLGIGYDFQKGKSKIDRLNKKKLKQLVIAMSLVGNYGDICKIDPQILPNIDIFTYSFPCQDISVAGNLKGLEVSSGTRSSLLWECCKIIEAKKPKVLLMENVKNLVGKKFKMYFDDFLEYLENQGYKNYWKVLNAKDYGVPQNRERVFVISVLSDEKYIFPESKTLDILLENILEEKVDQKYYLSEEIINKIKNSSFVQEKRRIQEKEVCDTLLARDFKDPKCVRVFGIFDDHKGKHQAGSVWEKRGLAPTLDTMQRGYRQPCVIAASRGRNPQNPSDRTTGIQTVQRLEINQKGVTNCITTVQKDNLVVFPEKIRKLTPKECFRLMGVQDKYFDILPNYISNSQLYKMAGNSIVVNVLESIFKNTEKYLK